MQPVRICSTREEEKSWNYKSWSNNWVNYIQRLETQTRINPQPTTIDFRWPGISQNSMKFICGKEKKDYLSSNTPISDHIDQKYKTWKAENNMVMSWQQRSVKEFCSCQLSAKSEKQLVKPIPIKKNYTSKLTCMKNCIAIFHSHNCIFQDLNLRKTIGNAKESLDLYVLNVLKSKVKELSFSISALMILKTIMIVQLCYGITV